MLCWSLDPWFSRIVERMAISLEFSNIIIIVILITLGKNHCKFPDLIPFFISFWNHLHFCGTESNFELPKIISEVVGGVRILNQHMKFSYIHLLNVEINLS